MRSTPNDRRRFLESLGLAGMGADAVAAGCMGMAGGPNEDAWDAFNVEMMKYWGGKAP
jgi:hypothetical protein